ncbi:unnamed protein product [Bathycoccus prasinos]
MSHVMKRTSEQLFSLYSLYPGASPYFSRAFLSPRLLAMVIKNKMNAHPMEAGINVDHFVNIAGTPATYNPSQKRISPK